MSTNGGTRGNGHLPDRPPRDLRPALDSQLGELAISRLHPEVMRAHQFEPPFDEVYQDTFAGLVRDSAIMPGMGRMDDILSERTAYAHTFVKIRDAGGNRGRHRFDPGAYDRMNAILIKCIDMRVKTAKGLNIDDVMQRHMQRTLSSTLGQLIDAVALTPDQAAKMRERAPAALRANF